MVPIEVETEIKNTLN